MTLDTIRGHLTGAPDTFRALTAGLTDDELSWREAPDHWTVFEVLCHVLDAEEQNWLPRIRVILAGEDQRTFKPMDRERGLRLYADWTVSAVLDEFARRRAESVQALEALDLTAADLQREAQHPTFGRVTLGQLLATWVTHDRAHVAQVARVLVRCHGAEVGPWRAFFSLLRDADQV
jgi:hypothetical protein